jgi:hypothetical protein
MICAAAIMSIGLGAENAKAGTYTAWYCSDAANRGIELRDWFQDRSGVGYITTSMINCPVGGDGGEFGALVSPDSRNDPNSVSDGFTILTPSDVRFDSIRLLWAGGASANGEVSAATVDGGQQVVAVLASYTKRRVRHAPGSRWPTGHLSARRCPRRHASRAVCRSVPGGQRHDRLVLGLSLSAWDQ